MTARSRKAPKAAESTPAPVVDLGCWFLDPTEEVRLDLPGGQWIEIKPELDAGETARALAGIDDEANFAAGLEVYNLRQLAMYLQDWSLSHPIRDFDVAKRFEMLRGENPEIKLRRSAFDRMVAAVNAYDKTRPKPPNVLPIDVALSDAWFLGPDDNITLPLPGGESVTIRAELESGAQAKLLSGLQVRPNGRAIDLELSLHKAAAYIVAWTLTYPNGKPVPVGLDSIKALRASRCGVLTKTIQAYEKALEARDANPTGASS